MAGHFSILYEQIRTNIHSNITQRWMQFVHTHKLRVLMPQETNIRAYQYVYNWPPVFSSIIILCLLKYRLFCMCVRMTFSMRTNHKPSTCMHLQLWLYYKTNLFLKCDQYRSYNCNFVASGRMKTRKINNIRVNNGNDTDNGEMKMN